jgi:transposase
MGQISVEKFTQPGSGLSENQQWAILASLINTAKLHEIDPQSYLADVLDRVVSGRTKVNALHELLPWAWKAAQSRRTALAAA